MDVCAVTIRPLLERLTLRCGQEVERSAVLVQEIGPSVVENFRDGVARVMDLDLILPVQIVEAAGVQAQRIPPLEVTVGVQLEENILRHVLRLPAPEGLGLLAGAVGVVPGEVRGVLGQGEEEAALEGQPAVGPLAGGGVRGLPGEGEDDIAALPLWLAGDSIWAEGAFQVHCF